MKRNAATERQVQAADPSASTWLSANAGSGKTRVLTDRVARLLLNGVLPQHILCLTYTKAAASEMQNRLFLRLGAWAMMPDEKLRDNLRELGLDAQLDAGTLRRARQLFARAIETPGGLKIQTIHSFCAAILRRFPIEAGVSPMFQEMDDRAAKTLSEDVCEDIAQSEPDVFADLVRWHTGEDLLSLTGQITRHRDGFSNSDPAQIWASLNLPAGFDRGALRASVLLGNEHELIAALVDVLQSGGANDNKAAAKLKPLLGRSLTVSDLPVLESVFLTGESAKQPFSAKIGSFPTKALRLEHADLMAKIEPFMARVETARSQRIALATAEKTLALHQFAQMYLERYQAQKTARGWLDFDDLILRARDLLVRPGVAEWVLYRLDGGIDHILVDEAQDTSPLQWQVIDLLAQEFTAGLGARGELERTIFVVGDQKQSIYSFQGADPSGFGRMREHFDTRLRNAGQGLVPLQLEYSFRSSAAVLNVVDATFRENPAGGLGSDAIGHLAFRDKMPGRVDLWPAVEPAPDTDKGHWTDPVDIPAPTHHSVVLANEIAGQISTMIGQETLEGQGGRRPVAAGDILILVQRRSDLFHQIIAALKAHNLPVAGADRLKIGGELAVRDITALLSFLATPEDSLSLACALRSPLFGWSEEQLFKLAAPRKESYLWEALRKNSDAFGETVSVLNALRRDADFLRPYELIERVLTRHHGRKNLIARLGHEAEDGIDALLSQALGYERSETPSLTGFLAWLSRVEVEIKRQLDSAGDRIRVMTVHGSKGLEAPIVILPDTGQRRIQSRDDVLVKPGDATLWKPARPDIPDAVRARTEIAQTREAEERQRLLYVAMTRAEQWLITCAAGELGGPEGWYNQIANGMEQAGASRHVFAQGTGMRLEFGEWPRTDAAPTDTAYTKSVLPDWAQTPVPATPRPPLPIAPSQLGGAKALDGEGRAEEIALAWGNAIHLLLEHLPDEPKERWPTASARLLTTYDFDPSEILAEAAGILENADLAFLFAPDTLAEVEITAQLPAHLDARTYGIVDRLVIGSDHVLAIDYKSNRAVPETRDDVPEGLLRQMGAYAHALAQIFPDHRIDTAILWTRTAQLMPLSSQIVADALSRATPS